MYKKSRIRLPISRSVEFCRQTARNAAEALYFCSTQSRQENQEFLTVQNIQLCGLAMKKL
jgi:hypothetical protein